jgi:hypothetical protein
MLPPLLALLVPAVVGSAAPAAPGAPDVSASLTCAVEPPIAASLVAPALPPAAELEVSVLEAKVK